MRQQPYTLWSRALSGFIGRKASAGFDKSEVKGCGSNFMLRRKLGRNLEQSGREWNSSGEMRDIWRNTGGSSLVCN